MKEQLRFLYGPWRLFVPSVSRYSEFNTEEAENLGNAEDRKTNLL
jgi:hypothetical protein